MTRADIEKAYDVNASSGIIQLLGKFEGESIVVPHFYDQWQSDSVRQSKVHTATRLT